MLIPGFLFVLPLKLNNLADPEKPDQCRPGKFITDIFDSGELHHIPDCFCKLYNWNPTAIVIKQLVLALAYKNHGKTGV